MDGWCVGRYETKFSRDIHTRRDEISRFVNAKLMVRSFIILRDQFCYNLQYNYGLYGIIIIIPPSVVVSFAAVAVAFWTNTLSCHPCKELTSIGRHLRSSSSQENNGGVIMHPYRHYIVDQSRQYDIPYLHLLRLLLLIQSQYNSSCNGI